MSTSYTYATLPVIGEYDGQVKQQKLRITNRPAGSDRCCGRTAGAWSFETGSCGNKGKYVYENVEVQVTAGFSQESTTEYRTVQFCGTHDPVRRANKARDEYLKDMAAAKEREVRTNAAQARVNDMVREINELAGGKVVEAGWGRYSNQPEVRLYSPASLLDSLRELAGAEKKEMVS